MSINDKTYIIPILHNNKLIKIINILENGLTPAQIPNMIQIFVFMTVKWFNAQTCRVIYITHHPQR